MKFTELEKWKQKLHNCIRCGYCYEHCHIYKKSGWETDSPRGKLVMLFGMMVGNIEPSDYSVEKIFECYYCKRCDSTCSAKVPVTEIFDDAKKDFINAGFDLDGTVSKTNEDLCSRCLICVSICKHEARTYDKKEDKILIDKLKCRSCGCCASACPSSAVYSKEGYGLSPKELDNEIINILKGEAL